MSAGRTIVLASSNRGKLKEFAELLAPRGITIVPQSQFVAQGAAETGATFIENALLKARHAALAAQLPAIADDSGIEVHALQGAPGIYSARFAGENASDQDNNEKLLAMLDGTPGTERHARFRCALAYVRHAEDANPIVAEGIWEGEVLTAPRGSNGFAYDCLFLPTESQLSAAEMLREIKNKISHRAQALRELMQLLVMHGELE